MIPDTTRSGPKEEHKGLIGDSIWRILQVIAEVLSQFFAFFFVAKWLEPTDFGVYSVVMAIVYFFRIFSDFGLSTSSSKYLAEHFAKGEHGYPKSVIIASFLLSAIFLLIVSILYFGSSKLIGLISEDQQIASLVRFSTPLLIFATLWLLLDGLYRGARSIKALAIIDISCKILQVGALFLFVGIYNLGVMGAIGGLTIGYVWFGIIGLLFFLKKIYGPLRDKLSLEPVLKNVLSYGFTNAIMALAIYCYTRIDLLILGYFHEASEVGKYNFANGIINLPIFFLAAYTAIVAPVITKEFTLKKAASLQRLFTRSLSMTFYSMILLSVGIFFFSTPAIQAMFPKYDHSILLIKILSFSLLLRGLGHIAAHAFLVPTGNAYINTKIIIGGAFLNTILDLILIPPLGALGSVIVTMIVHTVTNLMCLILTMKKLKLEFDIRGITLGLPSTHK